IQNKSKTITEVLTSTAPHISGCYKDLNFDICTSTTGWRKSALVLVYLSQQKHLLPLLLVLVEWGRTNGLFGSTSTLTKFALVHMMIEYCIKKDFLERATSEEVANLLDQKWNIDFFQKLWFSTESLDPNMELQLGELLVGFFYYYAH